MPLMFEGLNVAPFLWLLKKDVTPRTKTSGNFTANFPLTLSLFFIFITKWENHK